MITREEIKKVEKLQKIENKIKQLKEDYKNIKYSSLCYYKGFGYYFLNGNYEKEMLSIIKHKILLFERKRKNYLKGNNQLTVK